MPVEKGNCDTFFGVLMPNLAGLVPARFQFDRKSLSDSNCVNENLKASELNKNLHSCSLSLLGLSRTISFCMI